MVAKPRDKNKPQLCGGERCIMEKQFLVIDIPRDATAEQAEALLSAHDAQDYYLAGPIAAEWPGIGARAFFKLRVTHKAGQGRSKADADGKDVAAKALIAANTTLTIPALVEMLADAGIARKNTWVGNTRLAIKKSGTKTAER